MSYLVVRSVGLGELSAVADLRRAWTEEDAGHPIDDDEFPERLRTWYAAESSRRRLWVAYLDSEPVGMVNMTIFERMPRPGRPASRWCYLGNAFVLTEQRNRGIGRALLDEVVGEARTLGAVRIVLSPSARARPFYARAGFEPASELLVMHLDAAPAAENDEDDRPGRF